MSSGHNASWPARLGSPNPPGCRDASLLYASLRDGTQPSAGGHGGNLFAHSSVRLGTSLMGEGRVEIKMPKLLLSMITGVVFAGGTVYAQTATTNPPNNQNPEATCPVGANCAPGPTSPSTTGAAQTPTARSDATGS